MLGMLWELPQTATGALLAATLAAGGGVVRAERSRGRWVLETRGVGVSLGYFVFWSRGENRYFAADPLMKRHELGHAVQSRWLGPLYLPFVGVPSAARAAYAVLHREVTGERWSGYFDGWPERSADRLGGIGADARRAQVGSPAPARTDAWR